jgi:hypothetical protein
MKDAQTRHNTHKEIYHKRHIQASNSTRFTAATMLGFQPGASPGNEWTSARRLRKLSRASLRETAAILLKFQLFAIELQGECECVRCHMQEEVWCLGLDCCARDACDPDCPKAGC